MMDRDAKLLAILRVGHETSFGANPGISLREALTRTKYRELRPSFGPEDLLPLIRANPALAEEWVAYSEGKRTTGGWYLSERGEIGRIGRVFAPKSRMRFDSLEEGVAEYVVRELDFWAGLRRIRTFLSWLRRR
ncbi:MAG TPA: hypothetical protein VGR43_01745 [Dehalococcoidia bacterium]|nr:hypothetical protein [Dehalococcoidia bacterium]